MSKKALIIDDDDLTTMSLKTILNQCGLTSESAENGNKGIEKLKNSFFDILFIDFHLPDVEGDKVLAKIKENGGSYGKAVLISGDDKLKGQFESKGFNFFLHKPVSKKQIQELTVKFLWLGHDTINLIIIIIFLFYDYSRKYVKI